VTEEPDRAARRRHELGHQLRAQRQAAGLTQEQLALDAGLDRSFYVDVENGHHSLTVDRLFAIADALGTQADQLLAGIN
jgi:transcriptional regulator with XRE-family HTH domain